MSLERDVWSSKILRPFRNPGNVRFQLISQKTAKLVTDISSQEGQWLIDTSAEVYLNSCALKNRYITSVGNGSWILDGSLNTPCKDNVYAIAFSKIALREQLPASWTIWFDVEEESNSVPTQNLTILWDIFTNSSPTSFVIEGCVFTGPEDLEIVWSKEYTSEGTSYRTDVQLPPEATTLTYDGFRITANAWHNSTTSIPMISGMYTSYEEDNISEGLPVIQLQSSDTVSLTANELPARNISVELSTVGRSYSIEKLLQMSEVLPEGTDIYIQYGLTFDDGSLRYFTPVKYDLTQYAAPTETRSITITGRDYLQKASSDIFKFNYIPRISTQVSLETVLNRIRLSSSTLVETSYWPSQIYDSNYGTSSMGALPKNTTVTQVLQYIAQMLEAVLFEDKYTGDIKATRLETFSRHNTQLNNNITIDLPAVSLDKKINKIVVKVYKIANSHTDLYGIQYSTRVTVPAGINDGSGNWRPTVLTLHYENSPIDSFEGPTEIKVSRADKNSSAAYAVTVNYIGNTDAGIDITWADPNTSASFQVDVYGYPGLKTFYTTKIFGEASEIITIEYSWDSAKRYIRYEVDKSKCTAVETYSGAYYLRLSLKLNQKIEEANPLEVRFAGADVEIFSSTLTVWDVSDKEAGETLTIDNPLISDEKAALRVGNYVKNLINRRETYQLSYVGDPAITPMEDVTIPSNENSDTISPTLTSTELTFNGGYRGTLKGRIL